MPRKINIAKIFEKENKADQAYYHSEIPVDPSIIEEIISNEEPRFGVDNFVYIKKNQTTKKLYIKELRDLKSDIILKLTLRQTQCVYLYYWQNISETKIGEMLDLHQTTVSWHLKYARKKIKKLLEGKIGSDGLK